MDAVFAAIRGVRGVAEVFRVDQLGELAEKNPLARAALLSEFPGRGGDLFVIPKPNWFFDRRDKAGSWGGGTTHGTPYAYDQRVPIILMGAGIRGWEKCGCGYACGYCADFCGIDGHNHRAYGWASAACCGQCGKIALSEGLVAAGFSLASCERKSSDRRYLSTAIKRKSGHSLGCVLRA